VAERDNTYTAFVDPRYTEAERKQIGIEIVRYIVDRTKNGQGVGKKPFKGSYSKTYVKTPEFEIANKSKNDVNLTLSGDMLDSVEVINTSIIGRIIIGLNGQHENDKSVWLEEKGFKFLGLTDKELKSILSDFGQPERDTQPADISEGFVEGFVRGLLGR
jgi:hypothetical protein